MRRSGLEQRRRADRKADAEASFFWQQVEFRRSAPDAARSSRVAHQRRGHEARLFGERGSGDGSSAPVAPVDAYDDIPVEVHAGSRGDYVPLQDFAKLDVDEMLMANVRRCGYAAPTPVQRHALPLALSGAGERDLLASAQTGSGKTAAFMVPMVAHAMRLQREGEPVRSRAPPPGPRDTPAVPPCLVVAPTRELAMQIAEEAERLAWDTGIRVACVYGGAKARPQLASLARGVDVLVATPGRLQDFSDAGFISASSGMPSPADGRQTSLFSATFPDGVSRLVRDYTRGDALARVTVGRIGSTVGGIEQRIVEATSDKWHKLEMLQEAIAAVEGPTIVFTARKHMASWYRKQLLKGGRGEGRGSLSVGVEEIHGDRTQGQREVALANFKSGKSGVLIATDVAARGLDVDGVAHVINVELPTTSKDIDSYTHRIGRTGRRGRKGVATSFYVPGNEPKHGNADIHAPLLQLLEENDQQTPSWFLELPEAKRAGQRRVGPRAGAGGRRTGRGGGRGRRGGRGGGGGRGRGR
eukprot:PRCOL_00000115-RA